ncbi:MAG: hemolysin family protein [Phycisphaerales bacterium]
MTPTDAILLWAAMPALLIASGIVSGSETALFGLTQTDRDEIDKKNPRASAASEALLAKPRSLLTAILLANMLVNVTYFTLSSVVVLSFESRQDHIGATAVGLGSLFAIVLFGEVIAKTTASAHRVTVSVIVAPLWLLLIQTLWPLWSSIDKYVMAPLTRLVSTSPSQEHEISADELRHIIGEGEGQPIDAAEQRLLLDVFRLGSLRVREVMTPRVKLPALSASASHDDVLELIRESRPERVLIYDDREAVLGLLQPSTYLRAKAQNPEAELVRICEHPLFIPEQSRLDNALEQLRKGGVDHAGVVDERGELVGLLRVEDVVAELIDEAQETAIASEVRIAGVGEFVVPGDAPAGALLVDLDPAASAQLTGNLGKVTTVAGVVLAMLGRLPQPGDSVRVGSLDLIVHELTDRAITSVIIRMTNAATDSESEGHDS